MDSTRGPQIWRDDRSNRRPAWGLITPHVSSLSLLVLVILGGACSVSAAPSTGRLSSAGHHPRLVSLKTRERVGDHDFRSRSDDESEYASNSTRVSELGGLFSDLNGYWWHGSRIAVGGALGARYEGVTKCIKRCDDMKHGCAGFVKEILSDHCTLVGRGYGLMQAAESDFYRKKALTNPAVWKTIEGMTARSPDIHAWRGVTASSRRELRALCAADSQCQGFYTCSDFDAFNCTKILNEFHSEKNLTGVRPFHTNASAMLLSSVPDSVSRMSTYPSLVLDSRAIKTCEGNADGASCTFPFTTDYSAKHRQNNVEYFGPTLEGSSRPWCYTSKPGLWGYVDCHGQDPMGFKWEISEWGNCSRSCKRGMKTRTANCVNTTSGAVLPNQLCGVEPETSQECNTHSCDEKCAAIGVEDRKRCAPFVQDPRSRFMNVAVRAEVCHEYGCCFDYSETVLGTSECYVHKLESEASGCKKDWEWDAIASGTVRVPKPFTSNGGKPTKLFWNGWHEPGPLMDGQKVSTVTDEVTMCGRSCCRGDTELGPCAYDLGYSKPGAGQCSRFKSILAPDRYDTAFDVYFGEGDVGKGDLAADPPRMPPAVLQTIKMFTSKECREECDAADGCTAANFNKAESICELIKADAPSIAKFWDADPLKRYHILNSTSSLGASPGGNRIGWTAYTRHLGTRRVRGFTNAVTHVLADPPPQWGECRVVPKGQQLDPECPWQQHKEIKGYVLPGDDIFRPDGYEVPWDKINSYHNGKPYMPLDDGDPDYPITYDPGMEIRKGPGPYNIHSIERPCYDVCNITKYCEDPLLSWYDSSSSNDETCSAPGNMATTRPGAIQHMTSKERRETVGSCDGHGGPRKRETRVNLETYEQASARCERFGTRLCEADEILRGAGLSREGGSGKITWEDANVFAPRDPWNYDPFKCTRDIREDNAYWTSTPCGVGGGNATGRFVATRGGGLGKQCASTSEVHLFACCSDFKNAGFKSAIAAASRKRMNITLGDYHYCRNQQCKVYEGHCKSDGECEYGTQCARRVGAKYGFHDKANVCIPTYDAQQIRFGPRQVLRGSPTNFVFVESGVYTIPNTAKVKIIDGDKFGCMGAWDDTAVTLAETELKRRSEHVVRLPGQPVGEAFSGLKNHKATLYANNKVCDGELHPELPRATESTRPFMEWNNALVAEDKTQSNFDPTFETRKAHMCMCDNSTDCEAPQNWHDLGVVKLDVPHIYTFRGFKDNDMVTCGRDMKCPKRETRFDVYTYYTTAEEPDNIPKSDGYVAGFGGDLFEVYNVVDMTEYYPEMLMTRFTYSEQISLFKEFCAQRCNGNPLCVGFDLVPTGVDGSGIKELDDDDLIQRQCRMYRDGVMLHVIPSSGHQFYFSTKPKRETWSWFPVQRKPGREIEFTTPGGFSQVAPEGVVGLRAPKFKLRGTSIERLRNFFLSMNVFGNPPLPSKKLDSHRIHGLVYYENLYSPYLMPSLDYVTDKHFNVHSGNGRVFFPSLVEPKEIDDRMALTETYITARNRNRRGQKDFPRARIAYETNLAKKECEVSVAPPLDVVNQTTDGGLYWPSDVGTCGGNAHGAPCYKMFSPDPRDPDLIYFQCHVPDGETRSMCYTDKARTLWGYCDCPNSQWSRPFGRRNTMHNAEFRGGEVVMLTDDLHAPIDSIACENGIRGPSYDCKVHVNKSMCISSEVYGEFHPWKGFNSAMDASHSIANYNYGDTRTEYTNGYESMIEVTCPPGMVLTGIAAIKDKTSEGVMPRCGTPAGWTVGRVEESTIQSLDSYNFVTYLEDSCIVYNPSGGSTKSGRCTGVDWQPCPFVQDPDLKCRRRPRGVGIDADYVGCGPGEVAVGFFWSARSGTSKRLGSPDEHPSEIMPMCAPVTSTEPFAVTSGDFQRACTAQICSNLTNTIDTDDVAKCLKLCESESTCRASEFIEGNATSKMSGKCLLYAGTCTESTTPYGRILNQALPSPVTTTNAPVTYTPVEFEHPVTIKDLITFKVSSVKGSTFERLKFKRWVGTPFSSCSKPCGVGVMHRKISCVMIGSVVNVTIPDSECAHLPKPPEMEYCNKFHCELQCRQDTKRRSCAMYEADDRRRSSQFLIRQQTCEGFGCCFVPKPWISDFERAGPGESECYEAPRLEYPQWVPLSFGECSEDCQDPGSSALPYRERNLACANAIDGRRVPSDLCPAQKPMAIQQCNTKEPCVSSNCGLPEDVGSCGHGTCERSFSSDSPWKSSEKCTCFEGWMTGPSGACDLEIPACESNEWQLGEWGECVAGGLRSREVTCATDLMRASCKPTCDESTRPESTSACHVASSSSESFNSIPTNWTSGFWRENFDADKNHFVIMPHMEMKITGPIRRWWVDQDEKWTKIQAGFSALEAALGSSEDVRGNDSPSKRAAICASMCRATPTCPGFVFDYSKNMANACGFIHRRQFEVTTISRSESKHVFMRRGFITSFPQDELVRVVNSTNAWSSDLAAKVVDSNERLARRRSVIPSDDGIWDWINTANTHGGVSLRKSLYSLAFPTHLNVLKHIRYLRNFLEPEFHGENLADVILAMAFKYRDYPSITNSTSTFVTHLRDAKLLDVCQISRETGAHDKAKMPLYRDPNPSPLGALHYLLKNNATASTMSSIWSFPWPILTMLGTAHVPKAECDYVRGRYSTSAEADRAFAVEEESTLATLDTKWYKEISRSTLERVETLCKTSNWHPNALPRAVQDGTTPARFPYVRWGHQACRGVPGVISTAGTLEFSMTEYGYVRAYSELWDTNLTFDRDMQSVLHTDDVPGIKKNRAVSVDHGRSTAIGINHGLDSNIDTRLAMLLFHNVYQEEGSHVIENVSRLLISALRNNPHNIEAWDLLISHITLGSLTNVGIIRDAYEVFRPVAKYYTRTFGALIEAMAMAFDCETDPTVHKYLMEEAIIVTRPQCDMKAREEIINGVNRNCKRHVFTIDDVKFIEEDFVRLAWGECEHRLVAEEDTVAPFYTESNRTRFDDIDEGTASKKDAFARLFKIHFHPLAVAQLKNPETAPGSVSFFLDIIKYITDTVWPQMPLGYLGHVGFVEGSSFPAITVDSWRVEHDEAKINAIGIRKKCSHESCEYIRELKKFRLHDTIAITSGLEMLETLHGWSMFAVNLTSTRLSPAVGGYPVVDDIVCETFLPEESCEKSQSPSTEHAYCRCSTFKTTSFKEFYAASAELTKVVNLSPIQKKLIAYVPAVKASIDNADLNLRSDEEDEGDISRLHARKKIIYEKEEDYDALTRLLANVSSNLGETTASRQSSIILNARARSGRTRSRSLLGSSDTEPSSSDVSIMEHTTPNAEDFAMLDSRSTPFSVNNDTVFDTFSSAVEKHSGSPEDVSRTPVNVPVTEKVRVSEAPAPIAAVAPASALPVFSPLPTHSNDTKVITTYSIAVKKSRMDAQLKAIENVIKTRLHGGIKFHKLQVARSLRMVPTDGDGETATGEFSMQFTGFLGKHPKGVKRFSQVSAGPKTIAAMNGMLRRRGVAGASITANYMTDVEIHWSAKHEAFIRRTIGGLYRRAKNALAAGNRAGRNNFLRGAAFYKRLLNTAPRAIGGARRALLQSSTSSDAALGLPSHMTDLDNACVSVAFTKNVGDAEALQRAIYACGSPAASSPDEASKASFVPINNDDDFRNALKECTVLKSYCCPKCAKKPFWGSRWGSPGCCDDDRYADKKLHDCERKYGPISSWDTSKVTNMDHAFRSVTAKVGPHGYPSAPRIICVTQSINQSATGRFDDVANIDISNWDVSNVKSMNHMFHGFIGIYGDLSGWNVSQVTSMSHMFDDVRYLANTSTWDTSKVTDMSYMFKMHEGAPAYNRALLGNFIENFNVSAVTTMKRMFEHFGDGYHGERQRIPREFLWDNTPPMDLSRWELSSLTNMHSMFYRATTVSSFLHGAKDWDVRKVEDMSNMFQWSACGTLIDLSGWKTTSLRNMDNMFRDFPKWSGTCSANLSGWDLRSMTSLDGVFYNSKWTVLDLTGWNTSNIVSMAEMFKNAHIAPGSLETLNVHGVQNFEQMLCGTEWPSSNVDLTSWDVSRATNMKGMFRKANVKQIDVSTWDVRAVTSMANMFDSASNFNGDLSRWEPNKVTTMVEMFLGAVSFANDSPIRWRPTSLTTSVGMFNGAFKWLKFFARESEVTTVETSTDGPPFLWSVKSNVVTDENMRDMVERCLESNPVDGNCESLSIGIMSDWDVSRVTDMSELFLDAIRFNADISRWNVGAVTTMDRMFMGASAFNQDISAWKLTELVNSRGMFYEAKAFSQDITNWEIPNLSTSANMFGKATEILKHCKRDGQEKPITWSASGPPSKWKCDYPPKPPHAPSPPPNPSPPPIKDVIKEIHQGNFVHAITVCLSSNPIDGNCFESGYGAISDWDTSEVTDMSEAFANANEFNGDIERWDVSRVKKMFRMFYRAYNFNGNLTNWNVAEVTDMNQMFAKAYKFNGDIASWNVRSSPDMYLMFQDAKSFEANVTGWSDGSDTRGTFVGAIAWHKKYVLRACGNNIDSCGLNADSSGPASFRERIVLKYSALTDQTFRTAFKECLATNPLDGKCDLGYGWMSDWDTSAVTDMSKLFYRSGYGYRSQKFSVDISNWDTSNVTNMKQMFQYAKDWNGGEIGNWDVGAVTDMSEMFQYSDFNVDIGRWNVSAVTSFQDTFASSQFNKPIGDWPVRAASMRMMFASSEFNQDISRWDTSEVTDMSYMFWYNDNFDQDLSGWSVAKNPGRTMMFYSCSRFGGANYAPKSGYGCHQCFDNCCELHVYPPPQPAPPFPPPLAPGVVLVFEDKASLKEAVDDCLERDPVNGCAGMDTWDVSNVTNMESMFSGASSFNGDISGWDVSKVTNMERMFMETNSFNGDISGWDVSKVTNMERMFKDASSFNGDISGWDVSKVTNMESMFSGAPSFNGDISGWDVSGVTRMERMFSGASAFNGDISKWDVSKVTRVDYMFSGASAFNCDISKWDVSSIWNMEEMFKDATSFNIDISEWNVRAVSKMPRMFSGATSFDQDISKWQTCSMRSKWGMYNMFTNGNAITESFKPTMGRCEGVRVFKSNTAFKDEVKRCGKNMASMDSCTSSEIKWLNMSDWDVSKITDMRDTFRFLSNFNGDISRWDVSSVTNMNGMFSHASAFNGDISKWDVSSVTSMNGMFERAFAFNGDISKWDVSEVTNMEKMFEDAFAFNGDISKWDVSEVTNMNEMFSGASAFNSDISEWDVSKCTDARSLSSMFRYASSFDQNLSSWNVPCEPYPGYHLYRSFYGTKMTESMAPSVPCPTLTSASASGLGASSSAFPRVARASPVAVCAAAFIAAVAVVVATRAALRARRYPTPTGFPVHVGEETALLLPRRDRDAVTTAPMFWRGRV